MCAGNVMKSLDWSIYIGGDVQGIVCHEYLYSSFPNQTQTIRLLVCVVGVCVHN